MTFKVEGTDDVLVPLLVNVISNGVSVTLALAWGSVRRHLGARKRGADLIPLVLLILLWIMASAAGAVVAHRLSSGPVAALLLATTAAVGGGTVASAYYRLWRVGVTGADRHFKLGLNPSRALHACRSDLAFLGTGATKLTSDPEFAEAVRRCNNSGNAVRLLLSRPDADHLLRAAARADRAPTDYTQRVIRSLRTIAELRNQRSMNIEVRFYTGLSHFRLMFLNDRLCLLAYNVYGSLDETEVPQVFLKRNDQDEVQSLYWAFEQYFEQQWAAAPPWDYAEYL